MSAEALPVSFVDTNIFVYALAADDAKRSPVAQALLRELMMGQARHTSTQVLQELFVTLTRKINTPLTPDQALRYLDQIAAWPVITLDYSSVQERSSSPRPPACHCGMRWWWSPPRGPGPRASTAPTPGTSRARRA